MVAIVFERFEFLLWSLLLVVWSPRVDAGALKILDVRSHRVKSIRRRGTGVVLGPSRAWVRTATKQWKWKRAARSGKVTEKCEPPGILPEEGRRPERPGTVIALSVGHQNPDHFTGISWVNQTPWLSSSKLLCHWEVKALPLTPLNCILQPSQCSPFGSESNHLIISFKGKKIFLQFTKLQVNLLFN